jgi:hypothetical protein
MTKPEPSVLELAAIKFAQAKAAMETHEPPYQGQAFAAKVAAWRGAQFELIEAAKQFTGEPA